MRAAALLILGVLTLAACGSAPSHDDAEVARAGLLSQADLPGGFLKLTEPIEESECEPAVLFRRRSATGIAISKGYRRGNTTLLETTGVFPSSKDADAALSALFSNKAQRCVVESSPAPAEVKGLNDISLYDTAQAVRYRIAWGSGIFIEVAGVRVGRFNNTIALITESKAAQAQLRNSILNAAAKRSRSAISE